MGIKILVIGSGGREHALVWKLAAEPGVSEVFCAPGNPGIAQDARLVPVAATDLDGLLAFAAAQRIDLTVVGPELPLELGVVDLFRANGLRIFGPSRAAAALECSKVFAKSFMVRHGIPTARHQVCFDADSAHATVARGDLGFPVVVKADGLAAGKGVVVAADRETADAAIRAAMEERQFGDAGARLVLEECLTGPEVSFFAVCDGARAVPLASAQDHKRIFDGDRGPNTGGMGAFAPSPLVDAALQARIMDEIVNPVVEGMRSEDREYRGFLYAGLMLTAEGPEVIEFNVRFGDPEAQVVVPMIAGDLAPHLSAAADGRLPATPLSFRPEKHVGVVIASEGYPGPCPTGRPITGLSAAQALEGVILFHAGTRRENTSVVTAGGRVLTVVGRAPDFAAAIQRAYDGVQVLGFEGMQYRRDIGLKALPKLP